MLPVTIIGGYLGAGKTTLVNRMLRQAAGSRLAVLVNEFGELPIDADLIEAEGDDLIALAGGCVCCAFGSDLAAALQRVADLEPRPDHVVIEASGVGMPSGIARTVSMLEPCDVGALVVLADATQVQQQVKDEYIGDTILRQIHEADLIVLTKSDLLKRENVASTQSWLEGASAAPVINSAETEGSNALLLGMHSAPTVPSGNAGVDDIHTSFVFQPANPCAASDLAARLGKADLGLARAKGFVRDVSGQTMLVQVVGRRWNVTPAKDQLAQGIVCIGPKARVDEPSIRAALAGF